jgi:heme-degrading monooxygenase HmoA
MFARHVTTEVKKDKIEKALKIYEESVIPEGKAQEGYRGIYLLANKETGKIISISFWDSKEHAIVNENSGYFREQVEKFNGILISPPVKEGFDVSIMLSKPK